MVVIETKNWRRITKPRARKLYADGVDVYCLAKKMNPENMFVPPALIEPIYACCLPNIDSFDSFVNNYIYYNCNSETGKDVYYYVKIS